MALSYYDLIWTNANTEMCNRVSVILYMENNGLWDIPAVQYIYIYNTYFVKDQFFFFRAYAINN